MPDIQQAPKPATDRNVVDTLMYILAGSVMTIMSISFLLWLRF